MNSRQFRRRCAIAGAAAAITITTAFAPDQGSTAAAPGRTVTNDRPCFMIQAHWNTAYDGPQPTCPTPAWQMADPADGAAAMPDTRVPALHALTERSHHLSNNRTARSTDGERTWAHGRGAAMGAVLGLALTACTSAAPEPSDEAASVPAPQEAAVLDEESGEITLAFAGDVHFEAHLARLLDGPRGALGPITGTLREADVAMVNLESAITERGRRDPKELEDAGDRYYFRTSPACARRPRGRRRRRGDVANNHAGDYGPVGVPDTLAAARARRWRSSASDGTGPRLHAVPRDRGRDRPGVPGGRLRLPRGQQRVWAAGPGNAGLAAAREARPGALLEAVRAAAGSTTSWSSTCTGAASTSPARPAAAAARAPARRRRRRRRGGQPRPRPRRRGLVGGHLRRLRTGQLRLVPQPPARDRRPVAARGPRRRRRRRVDPGPDRRRRAPATAVGPGPGCRGQPLAALQRCTGLAAERGAEQADDPAYASSVRRIGPALAERMSTSHRPGCPVPLRDLRHLRMTYRDFDGRARTGEMVVHRRTRAA